MEVSSGIELFMLQALRWSNAIEATCFWLILLFQDEDGGRLFCTDITEGRLKRSSWSCFILSLTKDLFLLCFVILHWSSQNQRKLGWGALFFFCCFVHSHFLIYFFSTPTPPSPRASFVAGSQLPNEVKGMSVDATYTERNLKWHRSQSAALAHTNTDETSTAHARTIWNWKLIIWDTTAVRFGALVLKSACAHGSGHLRLA